MSEVIDDKVDKFHESLMKRFSRKMLVAAIIFVVLFCSWYAYATYKEYDFWVFIDNYQLIREIEIVDGNVRKFNISMVINMGFPLQWSSQNVNITEMTYTINHTYENGTTYYWQVAILTEARFEELYRLKDLLGYRLSEATLRDYRMSFHCYPTLFRFLSSNYNMTDTIEADNLEQLHTIALNRFTKLYHELMQLPREMIVRKFQAAGVNNDFNATIEVRKMIDVDGINSTTADDTAYTEGWTIYLYKDGNMFDQQTTGTDGCFTWRDLGSGSYMAIEADVDGWISTGPTNHDFGVVQVNHSYSFTFTNFKLHRLNTTLTLDFPTTTIQLFPVILKATLKDERGNPVQGVWIRFGPFGGGGIVASYSALTDADGTASFAPAYYELFSTIQITATFFGTKEYVGCTATSTIIVQPIAPYILVVVIAIVAFGILLKKRKNRPLSSTVVCVWTKNLSPNILQAMHLRPRQTDLETPYAPPG